MPCGVSTPGAEGASWLPGGGTEGLEGFTGTRVEPGAVAKGLEKQGHPGPEEKHEQTHRGMAGNAGSGDGVDLGCTEVRRQVVGDEVRGQGMGKADQEEQPRRSEDSALFPVPSVPSTWGNSMRDGYMTGWSGGWKELGCRRGQSDMGRKALLAF